MGIIEQPTQSTQSDSQSVRQPPVSLYRLAEESDIVLIDTSSLIYQSNKQERKLRVRDLNEKRRDIQWDSDSLDFSLEQIREKGNFFFSHGVIREFTHPQDYERASLAVIKVLKPHLEDYYWKSIDFASEMEDKGRILRLNPTEQTICSRLNKIYGSVFRGYCLSEVDKTFLLSGLTLVRTGRKPVGLTNDTAIHMAWENIMAKERNDEEQFKMYIRTGFEAFEPLDFSKIPTRPTYN